MYLLAKLKNFPNPTPILTSVHLIMLMISIQLSQVDLVGTPLAEEYRR